MKRRDFDARCVELAQAQAAREQDTSCFLCGAIGDLLSAGSGQRVKCRDSKGCAVRRRDRQERAKSPGVWR